MEVYSPAYYANFSCIASACPDSCCKEWEVDVDAQTARFYRALPGELGDRLRAVLRDVEDGVCMTIENGRCPMWQQDGLCRLQVELGHDALCRTCREFPRLRHDYGDFVELGLELSCPEAARLILTSPVCSMQIQQMPGGETPVYDREVMELLRQSRKAALRFLRSADSVPRALAAILLFAHDVQAAIDSADAISSTPEDCLSEIDNYHGNGDISAIFVFFQSLEILTPQWKQRLAAIPANIIWSESIRNLSCYMFERYWLQAISDFDLVCRVKLAIVSCLIVGALGGDIVDTAQLFSKEIENDPDNVEAILDGAYTEPALTDANLLHLLLSDL